jgi:hypothetical protein
VAGGLRRARSSREPCVEACRRHLFHLAFWQDGRCAICGERPKPDQWGQTLVEDHDHDTGLTRGYLCRSCNSAEGSCGREVFRAYRWRNPAGIIGVKLRWKGCVADNCDCLATNRRRWLAEVIESGVAVVDQLGTLSDLLESGIWYSTCAGIGGDRCCEHGPETLPPAGRGVCPSCHGYWDDDAATGARCATCQDEGHVALSTATITAALASACQSFLAVAGDLPSRLDGAANLTLRQAAAADLARRHLTSAVHALEAIGATKT